MSLKYKTGVFLTSSSFDSARFAIPVTSCFLILLDSQYFQKITSWSTSIISGVLRGLGAFRESPDFIIFQHFNLSWNQPHFSYFARTSHSYSVRSLYLILTHLESFLFCKTCSSPAIKLAAGQLQSLQLLRLFWKQIHKNLNSAPVMHNGARGFFKKLCTSSGGRKSAEHTICVCKTLSQRYNYSIQIYSGQTHTDEILGYALSGWGNREQVKALILEATAPFVWIGVRTTYRDYTFQVFIPTRAARKSSIQGLFLPLDWMTWIGLSVTMATSTVLFWIIQYPVERERINSLFKGMSWLLLTLFEQSSEPLQSRSCKRGKHEKKRDWLVALK